MSPAWVRTSRWTGLSHMTLSHSQVVVEEGSMEEFLDKEDDEFLAKKPGKKVGGARPGLRCCMDCLFARGGM